MSLLAIRFFMWVAVAAGGIGLLWFVADKIGDAREAQVRAEFAEAARVKNVDLTNYNSAREAVDALVERSVNEALAKAAKVPSDLRYTEEQARAVTAIRRAAQ